MGRKWELHECDQVSEMAADMQHAKARSMMGTMLADGTCVPRICDSYRGLRWRCGWIRIIMWWKRFEAV